MLVTLPGIITDVRDVQLSNAELSILVTLEGMTTFLSCPIYFTSRFSLSSSKILKPFK